MTAGEWWFWVVVESWLLLALGKVLAEMLRKPPKPTEKKREIPIDNVIKELTKMGLDPKWDGGKIVLESKKKKEK